MKTPVWITHCSNRWLASDVVGAAAACVSTCGGRGPARSVAGDERNTSGPIAVSIPAGRATVGSVTGPAQSGLSHSPVASQADAGGHAQDGQRRSRQGPQAMSAAPDLA